MASFVSDQVKVETLGSSSIEALPTPALPTDTIESAANSKDVPTGLSVQITKGDSIDQSTVLKTEASLDVGSSPISAPPSSTKMEGVIGMSNGGSDVLGSSSPHDMDVDEDVQVKAESSKVHLAPEKGSDSPQSTTQADFDADPALWGLRRSGRAPKKVYVDSSAGEGSDDEVTFTGSKMRSKNGKGRGECSLPDYGRD